MSSHSIVLCNAGWGNNEKQCYALGNAFMASDIAGGHLVLQATAAQNNSCGASATLFNSGRIHSKRTFKPTPGVGIRVEASINIASGEIKCDPRTSSRVHRVVMYMLNSCCIVCYV